MDRHEQIRFYSSDRAIDISEDSITLPIHPGDLPGHQPQSTDTYVDRVCLAQNNSD